MIELLKKIITNVLTALYQPFWFAVILTVFLLFFYLYTYKPIDTGKGIRAAFRAWWQELTFFAEHPEFFIYLPGYRLTYEIFAAYRFDDTHLLGAFDFSKKKGRWAYIREVFAGISMGQNTREDVKVTAKDKFVTLSTCTSDQADGRYLVQAVLRKKEKTRQ